MHLDDTIVAVATPPGRGGIGVVRLAGPEARAITAPMLRLKRELEPGRATFGELIEPGIVRVDAGDSPAHSKELGTAGASPAAASPFRPGEKIDEVVVAFFQKPHSYTTDDIVEISAHGSPIVLRHIVELALARGARLATPGEFTMRAFLNGRIDLTQAEAVRDLIESQTLYQARVAAQQLEGALAERLRPIKELLVALITRLEAGIDFADDDVPVAPAEEIRAGLESVRAPLHSLADSFAFGKIVHEGLTLAIVGRPNVGKSSLFNRLVERERAIVTATPGTTRDLVTETVALEGIPLRLVDTAGIRGASEEAETIGIRKTMEAIADADVVLVVLDASQSASGDDDALLRRIEQRSAIVVQNKCDLGIAAAVTLNSHPVVRTSALTGEGVPELRSEILRQTGGESAVHESGFLTSARHQSLVRESLSTLANAERALDDRLPHEMLLLDLYNALRPLDEITGATTAEDILNRIFSSFCIGK